MLSPTAQVVEYENHLALKDANIVALAKQITNLQGKAKNPNEKL